MQESRTIDVRLPAGLGTSPDDLEVLRTTFQTIISLTGPGGNSPCDRMREMSGQDARSGSSPSLFQWRRYERGARAVSRQDVPADEPPAEGGP